MVSVFSMHSLSTIIGSGVSRKRKLSRSQCQLEISAGRVVCFLYGHLSASKCTQSGETACSRNLSVHFYEFGSCGYVFNSCEEGVDLRSGLSLLLGLFGWLEKNKLLPADLIGHYSFPCELQLDGLVLEGGEKQQFELRIETAFN